MYDEQSYVSVFYYFTRMYPFIARMLVACIRMFRVLLVREPYATRSTQVAF